MKIRIIILAGIFIFAQNLAQAMESHEKFTRIAIASSDTIKYESRWLDNPPRLIIKFRTPNVFGKLVKDTFLNEGVIKNITVSYYPSLQLRSRSLDNPPRLIIKFRTPNVFGKLVKDTFLNEGVIKNITVSYYPSLQLSS